MKVLVTGGAGFIGSHIADQCLAKGWEVAVIDNLSGGRRENVPADARFEEVDIRDAEAVERVIADFKPNYVSHQAAQASVAISVREPQLDADINVLGGLNVLASSVKHDVETFLFASTGGAIYGEVPDGTRAGLDTPPNPMSPYATSKFAFEKYLECFRHEHGLNYRVLRYANVYGPRQDPHGEAGVVAIFMNRVMAGEGIQINARKEAGDPGCVRDYVFIDDVAQANIASMENRISQPVINICTGDETDTLTLATTIESALSATVDKGFTAVRPGDVERSVLDPCDIEAALGGTISLADGIAKTADWFKTRQ
ncbi:MAG: NAD-dependent epimerase/dehydratase family protein [Planctomycetaceae bacterium]